MSSFKPNPLEPDPTAPTANDWLKMIGAVNKCGEEMGNLMFKYGEAVFGVNVVIFYENMSADTRLLVERLRYQNTRLKDGHGKVDKFFKM